MILYSKLLSTLTIAKDLAKDIITLWLRYNISAVVKDDLLSFEKMNEVL